MRSERSQPWVPVADTASPLLPPPPALTPSAGRNRALASNSNPISSESNYPAEVLISGIFLLPQGQRLGQAVHRLILGTQSCDPSGLQGAQA